MTQTLSHDLKLYNGTMENWDENPSTDYICIFFTAVCIYHYLLGAFFVVFSHSCFLTNIPSISSPSVRSKMNNSSIVSKTITLFIDRRNILDIKSRNRIEKPIQLTLILRYCVNNLHDISLDLIVILNKLWLATKIN